MASRSVGTVSVVLGQTTINLKLYLVGMAQKVSFSKPLPNKQIDSNITQTPVLETTTEVEVKEIPIVESKEVNTDKRYEYKKNKFVTLTKEEIDNIQTQKDTIDLEEFISIADIDPIAIEKNYYTGPDTGMDTVYQLLYQVLSNSNKAAVGTWFSKGMDRLVIIRPYQHGLVMHQMFYSSEVRSFDDMCDKVPLSTELLTMGQMLIDQLSVDTFDHSKYYDLFFDKLTTLVSEKITNEVVSSSEVEKILKESLVGAGVTKKNIKETISKAKKEKKTA
jgi:DNA end-binding protein Ku